MHMNHLFYSRLCQHCSIVLALLIAFDIGDDSVMSPSMPIVVVIITSLVIFLGMDLLCLHLTGLYLLNLVIGILCPWFPLFSLISHPYFWNGVLHFIVVYLELIFFVYCSVVQGILGIKAFSKWIYADFQMLVWLKWCVDSNILDNCSGKYIP